MWPVIKLKLTSTDLAGDDGREMQRARGSPGEAVGAEAEEEAAEAHEGTDRLRGQDRAHTKLRR